MDVSNIGSGQHVPSEGNAAPWTSGNINDLTPAAKRNLLRREAAAKKLMGTVDKTATAGGAGIEKMGKHPELNPSNPLSKDASFTPSRHESMITIVLKKEASPPPKAEAQQKEQEGSVLDNTKSFSFGSGENIPTPLSPEAEKAAENLPPLQEFDLEKSLAKIDIEATKKANVEIFDQSSKGLKLKNQPGGSGPIDAIEKKEIPKKQEREVKLTHLAAQDVLVPIPISEGRQKEHIGSSTKKDAESSKDSGKSAQNTAQQEKIAAKEVQKQEDEKMLEARKEKEKAQEERNGPIP